MTWDEHEDCEQVIDDVPVSPALKIVHQGEEQEDEDIIEWSEVQRLLYEQMWGPILDLPPTNDDFVWRKQWEDGVDASAFNTHDFQRAYGAPWGRYKFALERAQEEHRHAVFTLEMVLERIASREKYQVLKLVREGVIGSDECEGDMRAAVIWDRRRREALESIKAIKAAMWRRARR